MPKFKVLEEFVLNGVAMKVDAIIELDSVKSSLKSIQQFIEKVPDNTPTVPVSQNNVELNAVKPGEALTEEQKEKLAKENAAQSDEAYRMAAEQRAKDISDGREVPAVQAIADQLKEKLVNEEFTQPTQAPQQESGVPVEPAAPQTE